MALSVFKHEQLTLDTIIKFIEKNKDKLNYKRKCVKFDDINDADIVKKQELIDMRILDILKNNLCGPVVLVKPTPEFKTKSCFYMILLACSNREAILSGEIIALLDMMKRGVQTRDIDVYGYRKLKWDYKQLLQDLSNYRPTRTVLQYLSDYMDINIVIVDSSNMSTTLTSNNFNPFAKTVILLRYPDDTYSLVKKTLGEAYYTYTDKLVKKIINDQSWISVFNNDYSTKKKEESTFSINI